MKKLYLLLILIIMFFCIDVYALPIDDEIQVEEQIEEEIDDEELEDFSKEEKEEKKIANIKINSKHIVIISVALCLGGMIIYSIRRNNNG